MAKEIGIEDLKGMGAVSAEKLKESGYDTLMKIATSSPTELNEIAGIGEATAKKIIASARKNLDLGFETGDLVKIKRDNIEKIKTNIPELDALLGGGYEVGSVTEAFGAFSSGKTNMGHFLSVQVQLPKEQGGLDGDVIWVDAESTFRSERIEQIAKSKGIDVDATLKRIHVIKVYNVEQQMLVMEQIDEYIKKNKLNVKLLVIDSITSLFRSTYTGRGELAERQQLLNKHLHTIGRLADLNNICVYMTNQVMSNPGVMFGDPTQAIGGNIMGHFAQLRLYMRRGKANSRVIKVVDSPHLPDGECAIKIAECGIESIEE